MHFVGGFHLVCRQFMCHIVWHGSLIVVIISNLLSNATKNNNYVQCIVQIQTILNTLVYFMHQSRNVSLSWVMNYLDIL